MAPTQHRSIRPDLMHRHAYQVAHLISTFTVPMMRDLYRRFDGDMVAILVLGEIAIHNLSQFFERTGQGVPEQWLDDEQQRHKFLRPCNALSISEATGIPRETVRRKVNQLIEQGWLYRDQSKGLVLQARVGQGFADRNARLAAQIIALADQLRDLLIDEASAAPDGPSP